MLRKLGTLLALGVVLAGAPVWAQSGNSGTTQVVLTNALHFTVANGKYLSGVYECSEGGYIDISCLLGQFPPMNCPAGQAIQSIDSSLNASCINVGAGSGPAGSDTWIQYNAFGIFGADANFTWNYTNSVLTLGGGGPGLATFSGDTLTNLGTPSDGSIAYCSNCNAASSPCTTTGSPTGSMAQYINGAWDCFAGASTTTTPGGSDTEFQYNNANTFGGTTGFVWDDSAKLKATLTFGALATGDAGLTITGTQPTTGTSTTEGLLSFVTSAGSTSGANQMSTVGILDAGYTNAGSTAGAYFKSLVANTGTDLALSTTNVPTLDAGVVGISTRSGTGGGYKVGGFFTGGFSTGLSIGVFGQGVANSNAGTIVGVMGVGAGSTEGSNLKNVGGYFDAGGSAAIDRAIVNANVAVLARTGAGGGGGGDYLFWGQGANTQTFSVKGDGTLTVNTGGGPQAGVSGTKTVRDAAGTGTCTLVFTSGLLTGGSC